MKGKEVWSVKAAAFWPGGVMTTANGLIVQGSADGYLSVVDSKSGKLLHRINIGTGIMAAPMSYEIDGEQYIAVTAGVGGALGGAFLPGWAALTRDNASRLVVFKLGGAQPQLPPLKAVTPLVPPPPPDIAEPPRRSPWASNSSTEAAPIVTVHRTPAEIIPICGRCRRRHITHSRISCCAVPIPMRGWRPFRTCSASREPAPSTPISPNL